MGTRKLGSATVGFLLLALAGCPNSAKQDPVKKEPSPPKVELKEDEPKGGGKPTGTVPRPGGAKFREAVITEAPDGESRPVDVTMAGKNPAKMYEAIAGTTVTTGLWEKIGFTTPGGKKIRYTAHLKTDLGTIEIELFADEAPTHVRNFIALAQAGYYDGLCFHRSVRNGGPDKTFSYLEGGCPKGTGDSNYDGSMGYWLKPEISPKLKHEEGTVGAWHREEIETASCKFYITLCQAPDMDRAYTIFGKIKKGLDVAHTINKQPVHEDAHKDRPREPVIIREVTIHSKIE